MRNVPQMKIDNFSGKHGDDFKMWFSRFSHAAAPQGWDDATKRTVMIGYLKDSALNWYMSFGEKIEMWPEFLAAFRRQFDRDLTMPEWSAGLNSIKLKEGQTVGDFICLKMAFVAKCPTVLDLKSQVQYAWSGLPSDISYQFMTRNCETLEQCLDFAASIDRMRIEAGASLIKKNAEGQNKSAKWGQNRNEGASGSNSANNSSSDKKPVITDKNDVQYGFQKFNKGMDMKDANCYKCLRKGHMAKNCPNPRVDRYDYKSSQKPKAGGATEVANVNTTANNSVGCAFEIIRCPIACIPVSINGVVTHACDDHGSSLTFVDQSILSESVLKNLKPWTGGWIRMVDKTTFVPLGELENVKVKLGESETQMKVAVLKENMVPVLLGDDFRSASKLKITCFEGQRCYQKHLGNNKFECVFKNENCDVCKIDKVMVAVSHEPKYQGGYGLANKGDYQKFQQDKIDKKECAGTVGLVTVDGKVRLACQEEADAIKKNAHLAASKIVDDIRETVGAAWYQSVDQSEEETETQKKYVSPKQLAEDAIEAVGFMWDQNEKKFI